jgi:hypothetical protein
LNPEVKVERIYIGSIAASAAIAAFPENPTSSSLPMQAAGIFS